MSIPRVPVGALALVILAAPCLWAAGPQAGAVTGGGLTINDVTVTEGNSGTTNAVFTVTLNVASALVVSVDFATADGTATAPADYVATAGTVSFAPGTTTASLTVPVAGDSLDEFNEGYFVNLSNPVNANIADGQGVGTINDNDPLPLISITDATVLEGDSGTTPATFSVTLNTPSGRDVTVDFITSDDTATAPADYAFSSGTLSFAPGTTSQTITVLVAGDLLDETNEDYLIDLFNPVNATFTDSQAFGVITDDDNPPSVSISDVTVTEGNSGTTTATFNVTLSAPSGSPLQVDFATANGTAVAPGDYAATSGTLSFPRGVTARTVNVSVVGDTLDEADENFNVNLTNPVNVTIADGQGIGTITDDDGPPSVSIADAALSESLAPNTFTVTLSAPSGLTISVDFSSADGTATAPADYTATSGTLSFAPGTTSRTIPITVINDPIDENAETMFVNLTNPVNVTIADSQGLGTIADNDNPPRLSINDVTVTEGNSGTTNAVFTVSLNTASGLPITVNFATADGSATAPDDYTTTSGTLSFPAGTTTQTVTVPVVGDVVDEANETFNVNLSGATNAIIQDGLGVGTITDDDTSTISIDDVTVTEGNAGTTNAVFTVSLSTPSASTVNVDFATADGSANAPGDYLSASGTLTFAPGSTAQSVTVAVVGEVLDENNETFLVNLSNPVNAPIADSQGVGTITDDDTASIAIGDATVTEGNAGTVSANFSVTLSTTSSFPVTLDFATADGSATAPADYVAGTGSLSFAPGQTSSTVTVLVNGDTLDEADETFFVNLTNPVNAPIADGQGLGTITDDDNAPSISINDVTVTEGNSGTTNAVFAVSLSAPSGLPISVDFTTANGSATAPGDYTAASGTLSFPRGATTQTITVAVVGDVLDENDETFLVDLTNASNASIADNQGVGTISDDDNAPSISINDVTVTEGNSGTTNAVFTASLSAQSGLPISVDFATANGSATAPGDYSAASGTLSFPAGSTVQTITVAVVGDVLDENDESFLVNLSNASNASIADNQGVGTITDDDTASIAIGDATVTEGNAGTVSANFSVTLSTTSSFPVTLDFATADGSATAPADYAAGAGTLSFAPGQTSSTVTVLVNGDTLDEADETFFVNLTNPVNAPIADGQGLGTITDDDNAPSISINDVTVTEGNSGTTNAVFTVSLSAQSGLPVTVNFATADGTATAPGDYTAASGTLSFPRGTTTQTITVAVLGDLLDEVDETFLVNLGNPTNASILDSQGLGTITDDDNPPSLSINDVTVIEGNAGTVSAVFTVSLDAPSGLPISVDFASADGTATAPADYTATSGTLSFPRGTTTATLTVNVVGDTLPEAVESFFVNLTNATNAAIADAQGAGTITDDDNPPSISVNDVTVTEGDTGTVNAVFTVSLSAPSGLPITVDFATADGTATAPGDYTSASGTLSFPRGTTTQTITVAVAGDTLDESDETFLVNLTNATNATIADAQGVGTISDDDTPPAISITDVTLAEGDAGTVDAVFTVSLSAPGGLPVTVDFATSDGTATAPADYTASSGTVSFPRGTTTQTITVTVVGDTLDEADETFNVDLTNPTNASIADPQGVGTITDDDSPPAISIDDVSVVEGNSGTQSAVFTVSLSAPSGLPVSVDFATSDGTATAPGDYTPASGTLSFAAGETTGTVSVDVVGDTLDEADETFNVDLTNPSNASIADAQGVGTIIDDDGATTRIELVHGSALLADLSAQGGSPDSDVYAISQRPGSSYEAVVDANGGDVVPIQLERIDSAGGVLQTAVPIGAGSSQSLRWATSSGTVVNDESIRVRSGNCTSSCGPEDGYRIRLYETTASIARFNNSSTQLTVLVLQNTGETLVSGTVRFWNTAGAPAGQQAFTLSAKQAFVLGTAAVAPGVGGSITIAHDGQYGQLTGKAVAVETATGFTFDTSLGYRPR